MHVPDHDWQKIGLICRMLKRHRVSFVVQLGDFLDLHGLSRWQTPGDVENQRLIDEFDMANNVLDDLVAAARFKNPKAQVVLLEGNHEKRIKAFYDQHPYLNGVMSVPDMLRLREREVDWVPSWSESKILRFDWTGRGIISRQYSRTDWMTDDGVAMIHGWYHNQHCAKKTAEAYGRSGPILFGHTHCVQTFMPPVYGWPRPFAASIGHLRKMNANYIVGADRWQSAFAVVRMHSDNPGVSQIDIVNINEDRDGNSHFWYGDRHYSTTTMH